MNRHKKVHSRRFDKEFWYKCPKPGCKSSFDREGGLDLHLRIHNNDVRVCIYCPYRYVHYVNYQEHLRAHFEMKDFICDQCDAKFRTIGKLNIHYKKHEGLTYACLICKNYETASKHTAEMHLRRKHADIFGKNVNASDFERHIKIK